MLNSFRSQGVSVLARPTDVSRPDAGVNLGKRFSRRTISLLLETFLVAFLFIASSGLLGFYLWSDINRYSDTALLLEITESIAHYGAPYSQVNGSINLGAD